jgi:hypothetical protein
MDDIQNYQVIESLRDQRKVTIRAIRPDDKGLIVDGLNTVSAESIYRRFLTTKKEITPQGLKLVTEVDFVNGPPPETDGGGCEAALGISQACSRLVFQAFRGDAVDLTTIG